MKSDWVPKVAARRAPEPPEPVPQPPMTLRLESVAQKAEPAPAPRAWRFVPRRDENNLIVEIIATPID